MLSTLSDCRSTGILPVVFDVAQPSRPWLLDIGRDVRDMLPDERAGRSGMRFRCLLAILVGNTRYFASSPFLPTAARMDAESGSGVLALVELLPLPVRLWGLNLAALGRRQNEPKN
jgi:hypothetical protein